MGLGARLDKEQYLKLDQKYGIKTEKEEEIKSNDDEKKDKEKDISTLIKEKNISSYVGIKYYMEYEKLLSKEREYWFKLNTDNMKHNKFNKFYSSFNVNE